MIFNSLPSRSTTQPLNLFRFTIHRLYGPPVALRPVITRSLPLSVALTLKFFSIGYFLKTFFLRSPPFPNRLKCLFFLCRMTFPEKDKETLVVKRTQILFACQAIFFQKFSNCHFSSGIHHPINREPQSAQRVSLCSPRQSTEKKFFATEFTEHRVYFCT